MSQKDSKGPSFYAPVYTNSVSGTGSGIGYQTANGTNTTNFGSATTPAVTAATANDNNNGNEATQSVTEEKENEAPEAEADANFEKYKHILLGTGMLIRGDDDANQAEFASGWGKDDNTDEKGRDFNGNRDTNPDWKLPSPVASHNSGGGGSGNGIGARGNTSIASESNPQSANNELLKCLAKAAELEVDKLISDCLKYGYKYNVEKGIKACNVSKAILGLHLGQRIQRLIDDKHRHADAIKLLFVSSSMSNYIEK